MHTRQCKAVAGSYFILPLFVYICMSFSLTDSISNDRSASSARCGEVAGGCTRQVKESSRQRCRTSSGDERSVDVRPRVARNRATVRHTRQLVTLFER